MRNRVPHRERRETKCQILGSIGGNSANCLVHQQLDSAIWCAWNSRKLFDQPARSDRNGRQYCERENLFGVLSVFDRAPCNEYPAVIETLESRWLDEEMHRRQSSSFEP